MPANKYALLRYRIIDRCLRNARKPYPSKEDLRAACEEALYGSEGEHISMSTIDKDIWAMRNEGELGYYAPIKFDKERGGYLYEDPEYTITEVPLTDDDLDAIRVAAATLYQFKDVPIFDQFEAAIEKIMDRMKISAADTAKKENEIIRFERQAGYKGSEFLEPLFRACSNKTVVKMQYQKFGNEDRQEYEFAPYIIKEYRNRWYVIGKEYEKNALRTFSLDRVVEVTETGEAFRPDPEFDAQTFFSHSVGITVTTEKPEEVELWFSPRITPYILTQPIHSSQRVVKQDDGSLVIHLKVLVTIELISTILGFGDDVKVNAPGHLKSKVKQALTDCIKLYE